jgi:hypothetical protein
MQLLWSADSNIILIYFSRRKEILGNPPFFLTDKLIIIQAPQPDCNYMKYLIREKRYTILKLNINNIHFSGSTM